MKRKFKQCWRGSIYCDQYGERKYKTCEEAFTNFYSAIQFVSTDSAKGQEIAALFITTKKNAHAFYDDSVI
jgi:hypothetical protein